MKTPSIEYTYPKIYLYKRIVHAKLFIDDHYGEEIDLENISDEACFSKFHFIRLFKNVYGKTPHQYLISIRLEKSKLFLQKGCTVTESCFSVGFDSISTFSLLFKKVYKVSPSVYRQKFRQRMEEIRKTPLSFIPNCFAEQKGWLQKSNFQ